MPPTKKKAKSPKGFPAQVKAALTRKLGPAPAWVWFVVAAIALYYYRKRKAASAATTTQPTATVPTLNYVPVTTGGGGTGTGSGSGSGGGSDGGSSGGSGSGGGPPPPPTSGGVPIWIHGNPGHVFLYTGDPSTSAWFQLDGAWYYYAAGQGVPSGSGYAGSAYPQGSPYMPPGAGQPPSNAAQAAVSASQSSTGSTIVHGPQNGSAASAIAPGSTSASAAFGPGWFAGQVKTFGKARSGITRLVSLRPRRPSGGRLHHPMPPFRWPPQPPPTPTGVGGPTSAGTTRVPRPRTFKPGPAPTATGDVGRPRPTAAYNATQIPSHPDVRDYKAVAPAPGHRAALEHLQGGLIRAQARSAEARRQAGTATRPTSPARTPSTGRTRTAASAKTAKPRGVGTALRGGTLPKAGAGKGTAA